MSGPNGLHSVANLNERRKCPKHPSKRKFYSADSAQAAAAERSKVSGLEIEPYLCDGCGHYHLTKSTGGSNTVLRDGKFSVGEFASVASPRHPVFTDGDAPPVPGDHPSRVKFLREWLMTNPEPTTEEALAALGGCSKVALRMAMAEVGFSNTRGRRARWVRRVAEPDQAPEPTIPETAPTRRIVNVERIRHIPVGDLLDSYAAIGMSLVLVVDGPDA